MAQQQSYDNNPPPYRPDAWARANELERETRDRYQAIRKAKESGADESQIASTVAAFQQTQHEWIAEVQRVAGESHE